MSGILVTGATGNVGRVVVRELRAGGSRPRLAVRPGSGEISGDRVPFDFTDSSTWAAAFSGMTSMLLVRPPAISNVRRDLVPSLEAARTAGVRHVVLLSLQGAERNRVTPHAKVEAWLRDSGMTWTFVRPSFFHQNLSTTHAADIRDRSEIFVPAGRGTTAFVDVEDVGAVAALALRDPGAHAGKAWTVTGGAALTYAECAAILSDVLGRPVRYARPGLLRYLHHAHSRLQMPWGMAVVTGAIYTTARLGLAAGITDDTRELLGRDPVDFRTFAEREQAAWVSAPRRPET